MKTKLSVKLYKPALQATTRHDVFNAQLKTIIISFLRIFTKKMNIKNGER